MEKCSKIGNSKIYRKDGRFECFSSCQDIDNGTFIYGNKDNSGDYICNSFILLNQVTLIQMLIIIILQKEWYKKSSTSSDCSGINYNYLKGIEYIAECNYFKGIDNSISPLKNCFEDLNECFSNGYNFYNVKEKNAGKNYQLAIVKNQIVGLMMSLK